MRRLVKRSSLICPKCKGMAVRGFIGAVAYIQCNECGRTYQNGSDKGRQYAMQEIEKAWNVEVGNESSTERSGSIGRENAP